MNEPFCRVPEAFDLEKPEKESKLGSISSYKTGLLPLYDSLLKSKESQIRALRGHHQQSSSFIVYTI